MTEFRRELGRLMVSLRDREGRAQQAADEVAVIVDQMLELAHNGDSRDHQRLRESLYLAYPQEAHDFTALRDEETAQLRAEMPYEKYLHTGAWQLRRLSARERAGERCQLCNGEEKLQVHHRTYRRRGAESPGDLTVLCGDCHALFHENRKLIEAA